MAFTMYLIHETQQVVQLVKEVLPYIHEPILQLD